jgi:transcriptional regulator with XRE-family HTH domain
MLLKRTVDNPVGRGANQFKAAGRSPAENLGLRVQAAMLAEGLSAEMQMRLAGLAGLQVYELTQLGRGKLPLSPLVEKRLTEELHVPVGYLAGRVTYAGEPIAAEVRDRTLSLPPWMLLLGESLVANAEVLAPAAKGLTYRDLAEVTGYTVKEVEAMWGGRDNRALVSTTTRITKTVAHVPSRPALQRLKAYLMRHNTAAGTVLPLPFLTVEVEEASQVPPPPAKVKARDPRVVPLLDQLAAVQVFSRDTMALPISWSPVLSALEKAAKNGTLKLNNRGTFTGAVVATKLHGLLEARGSTLHTLVDELLAEGHVKAFLQTDAMQLRKLLQRTKVGQSRAVSVGLMVALLAKLQVDWQKLY